MNGADCHHRGVVMYRDTAGNSGRASRALPPNNASQLTGDSKSPRFARIFIRLQLNVDVGLPKAVFANVCSSPPDRQGVSVWQRVH